MKRKLTLGNVARALYHLQKLWLDVDELLPLHSILLVLHLNEILDVLGEEVGIHSVDDGEEEVSIDHLLLSLKLRQVGTDLSISIGFVD